MVAMDRAVVCLNCDVLFDVEMRRCPACASETFIPIAAWLNRRGGRGVNATRYPLSWPAGWKRTNERQRARFFNSKTRTGTYAGGGSYTTRDRTSLTIYQAVDRLQSELARLGASREVLSTNVETRLDGTLRSDRLPPKDPGAAVYFILDGNPQCLACDKWDRVADNIAAIAAHIEAIRAVERYGIGTLRQAFAGYTALPPTHEDWWLVLGVPQNASREAIEKAYRALAMEHHPDRGGDHDAMAKINRAYEVAPK